MRKQEMKRDKIFVKLKTRLAFTPFNTGAKLKKLGLENSHSASVV